MSLDPTAGTANDVTAYIEEGARIAAILIVWGIIAAFFAFGVSNLGRHESIFQEIGVGFGWVFGVTGVLNAVLYVCFRTVDHYRR